jgi:hypothetical protein
MRTKSSGAGVGLESSSDDLKDGVEVGNATRTFLGINNYSEVLEGGGAPPGASQQYYPGGAGMATFPVLGGLAAAVRAVLFILARCPCCCERCHDGVWCPFFAHDRFTPCHKCFVYCCCMQGEQCCWGFPYTLCGCPEAWLVHGRENNVFNGGLVIGELGAPDPRYAPDVERIMHAMPDLLHTTGKRMLAREFQLVELPKRSKYSWLCSPKCCHCDCAFCCGCWHAFCGSLSCCPWFHRRDEKHASVKVLSFTEIKNLSKKGSSLHVNNESHDAAVSIQKRWRGKTDHRFHEGLRHHLGAQSGRAPMAPKAKLMQKMNKLGEKKSAASSSGKMIQRREGDRLVSFELGIIGRPHLLAAHLLEQKGILQHLLSQVF